MALVEPVPFPYEINWGEAFTETREYATTIQEAWDGTEQRRSLSDIPHRRFSYQILAIEEAYDEFQSLSAALYGGRALRWWVPYWPRFKRLTSGLIVGSTVIPVVSTTHMGLQVNQAVMLYRSPAFLYEVVGVTAINPTSVEVSPTTLAWTTRDRMVPC